MEPNVLVECAHELMRVLKEELAARRTVQPAFILVHDRDCELLTFPPPLFASAEGRAAVARTFRQSCFPNRSAAPSWASTATASSLTSPP